MPRSSAILATMTAKLRILFVEDNEDDVLLFLRELKQHGISIDEVGRVESEAALREALRQPWDVAICDYNVPGFLAPVSVALLREIAPHIPTIVVSGVIGEEAAVEVMRAGAKDYILKGKLGRLAGAILRELDDAAVRRDRDRERDRAAYLEKFDPITNLPTRQAFEDAVHDACAAPAVSGSTAVLAVEVRTLGRVREAYGLAAGDTLLRAVASRLTGIVSPADMVARCGDDFGILVPSVSGEPETLILVDNLLSTLRSPCWIGEREVMVEPAVGVAISSSAEPDSATLVQNAWVAVRAVENGQPEPFKVSEAGMVARAQRSMDLERGLREALARKEIVLFYQPKVDARLQRIVGCEALARWRRDGELVPPAEFIPLLEASGLIVQVGRSLIRDACFQAATWARLATPLAVAVNVSPRQLEEGDFVGTVLGALEEAKLAPNLLELEVTEGALVKNPRRARALLLELRAAGVGIAIDDFGAGYSSLAYVKTLPVSTLKIDQSFIREVVDEPSDAAIVMAVIALARALRIEVVAEGVETEAQAKFLRLIGVDHLQGYHFGKPMPADQLTAKLVAQGAKDRETVAFTRRQS